MTLKSKVPTDTLSCDLTLSLSLLIRQCVDLSCNELTEVTLPETLPQKLQDLDLTGNPRLNLDHKSLELLKYEPARSCSSDDTEKKTVNVLNCEEATG